MSIDVTITDNGTNCKHILDQALKMNHF